MPAPAGYRTNSTLPRRQRSGCVPQTFAWTHSSTSSCAECSAGSWLPL
uniref:Uncharacterized protein n=1 Tax=Anguilla anguilla TaxID=7936 RepID=A0A0E9VLZ6_ANGAN